MLALTLSCLRALSPCRSHVHLRDAQVVYEEAAAVPENLIVYSL
jgi:hypothetical protein